MGIGQRIKQARKAKALSLRGLAELVNVSPMAISKYERDMDMPSSAVLVRLASVLGRSIDYFFRTNLITVQLQSFRKHTTLGIKDLEAIQANIQDWLERYMEIESCFPEEQSFSPLPCYNVRSFEDVEEASIKLRMDWKLGLDPIENLTQLLEDRGIKIGLVDGFEHFDACTFLVNDKPVIVTKANLPGDRQRFNIGHELGHQVLDIDPLLDEEKGMHRFIASFLVPAESARYELGGKRTTLDIHELNILKHKYGLSMQAWIYRAKDLDIITQATANRLFHRFRANDWHRCEPGKEYPPEKPFRMQRLVYRALAEDIISRSKAQVLLGEPIKQSWAREAYHNDGIRVGAGL